MKKRNHRLRLLGLFGLALTLALPAAGAEVTFNTTADTAPQGGLFVYRMEQPTLSPAEAANKLGAAVFAAGHEMPALTAYHRIEDRLAYADDRLQFSAKDDGTELYFTDFPGLKLTEPTGTLPTDKEALARSHDFLRLSGLMPADPGELTVDHIGGIAQAAATPQTSYEPEQKAVVIHLARQLDGLRVMNYGSSITLTFGDGPGLVGLQYHWREVAEKLPVEMGLTVNSADLPGLIEKDLARVFAAESRISVDSIELVLHDNGGEFIQPAYCYRGTSVSPGSDKAMPVLGYVPLLVDAPSAVHHPGYSPDRPAFFGQSR